MTETKYPPAPPVLSGLRLGDDVEFTYDFTEGGRRTVAGTLRNIIRSPSTLEIHSIKVSLPDRSLRDLLDVPKVREAFTASAGAGTSTVVTFALRRVTTASGRTIAKPLGRRIPPTDAQVRYALSLCGRRHESGGGNFVQHTEAEFRAMTKFQISEWIDMAKDELGIGDDR